MAGRLNVLALAVPLLLARFASAQAALEARPERGGEAHPLALVEEQITVRIDRQFAESELRHTFRNDSAVRQEGQYSLRAGIGTEVQKFAYWNGEQKIVGEVFEKQEAQEIYNEVTGAGRDPGLLVRTGEGAFSFRVFPIEPGEHKRVAVTLQQWLPRSGAELEYRLPLGSPKARIVVELRDERPLQGFASSTHELAVERLTDGRWRVRATPRGDAHELWLRWQPVAPPLLLEASKHRDAEQDAYVALQLRVPVGEQGEASPAQRKDVTLVLDHSGSMSGQPLVEARLAAQELVAALHPDDRVNVIAFDDGADRLFARPQGLTDTVRRQTLDYLKSIQPGGGTDLALALRLALASQQPESGRSAIVLFLTDGQSAAPPVFEALRKDASATRVFTVGLGSGVDRGLLERLASSKRGRFTYVESAAAIRPEFGKLWRSLEEPTLVDLSVEAEGGMLGRVYPKSLADLSPGEELLVTGRLRATGPTTITVRGKRNGKPVAFSTVVDGKAVSRPWVGRLWAGERVRDLLGEIAVQGETAELKQETVDLALAYDLVTPYTAFLAIPESELGDRTAPLYASAKERKAARLAAHPDAVTLSRNNMPPGDPILTVKAPRDAKQVTVTFPFGLVKDLVYDEAADLWKTRFLVPNTVADGVYEAAVLVVNADGTIDRLVAAYVIDAREPAFAVKVEPRRGGLYVLVETAEEVRECRALLVAAPQTRVQLQPLGKGRFGGLVPASTSPGVAQTLRVVVADQARNEAVVEVTVAGQAAVASAVEAQ